MKERAVRAAAVASALVLAAMASPAIGQQKAPAGQAQPAPTTKKAVRSVEVRTPVERPSERLSKRELGLAKHVHTGTIPCERDVVVEIRADEKNPGFFHVIAADKSYYMHPVESRTGAMRMEDTRAGAMWLQLGNKSMLMDQKVGRRVADGCADPEQMEFAARMKDQPAPRLLGD